MPDLKNLANKSDVDKVIDILRSGLQYNEQGQSLSSVQFDTPIADLAIDSLLLSELIFDLEDGFGIQLSDDGLLDLTGSETIGEFIDTFLNCYKGETAASGSTLAQSEK